MADGTQNVPRDRKIYIPGFEKPFIVPDGMTRAQYGQILYKHHEDAIKKAQAMKKYMGTPETLGSPELGAAMIGAGDTVKGLELGSRDILSPTGLTTAPSPEERMVRGDIRHHVSKQNPGSFAAGQALPFFSIPMGAGSKPVGKTMSLLPKMGRVGEYLGKSAVADAAITGAILGAADDQMSVTQGGGAGAIGGMLGKGLGTLMRPSSSRLDPHLQQLAQRGEQLGYELLPSQRTGSMNLARLEDAMENNFFMSGGMDKITEKNQKNANRIVAESLGFQGKDAITPDMLNQVRQNFSDQFDALTVGQDIRLGDEFVDTLQGLENTKFRSLLGRNKIQSVIDEGLDVAAENQGFVRAEDYQAMSSELTQAITSAYRTGKAPYAKALEKIKTALDDAVEASLGGDTREAFRQLRSDYRVYKMLMQRKAINEQTGDVNLKTLATTLRNKDEYGFRMGNTRSDLYDAAQFESAFPGKGMNSLTASRMSIPQSVGTGMLGMGLAATQSSDPLTIGASGLAFPLSLWAGGKYYHSPLGRHHIGKGLLPLSDALRSQLTQKAGLLSLAAAQE